MREGIGYLSFTDRGAALAETIRERLGGEAARCGGAAGMAGAAGTAGTAETAEKPAVSLSIWTESAFRTRRALVYVGAVGIAVRAVASYLRSKAEDPAVVCVDEAGRFAVPLLSGHLGGANNLARSIAAVTGGTAVITTATDLRGVFAVDEWAARQDCAVVNPERIKTVSGKLLAGRTVRVCSAFPVAGEVPEGVELVEPPEGVEPVGQDGKPDIILDIFDGMEEAALRIVPCALVLGAGCRKGTAAETLEARFRTLCREAGLRPEAFRAAATIDVKADEPGLAAFCAARGWPLCTYSAAELRRVPGTFTDSAFVAETVGVGNVCERAAVLAAGDGMEPAAEPGGTVSPLLVRKCAGDGVTLAVARGTVRLDWNWR